VLSHGYYVYGLRIRNTSSSDIRPHSSPFAVEIAIANFIRYKSPGSGQIPAELIQTGVETIGCGCVGALPEGFYVNLSRQWIVYVGRCKYMKTSLITYYNMIRYRR
jgi:hypothetical protein